MAAHRSLIYTYYNLQNIITENRNKRNKNNKVTETTKVAACPAFTIGHTAFINFHILYCKIPDLISRYILIISNTRDTILS